MIPQIVAGNRDPKAIFCEELNKYVLALYFDGSRYGLFVSDDLLHWEKLQEVTLDGDAECPDILFKMAIAHGIISKNPLSVVIIEKHKRRHESALIKAEEKKLYGRKGEFMQRKRKRRRTAFNKKILYKTGA